MSVLVTLKKRGFDVTTRLKEVLDEIARNPTQNPFPLLFPSAGAASAATWMNRVTGVYSSDLVANGDGSPLYEVLLILDDQTVLDTITIHWKAGVLSAGQLGRCPAFRSR